MAPRILSILLTAALAFSARAAFPVVRNPTPILVGGNPFVFLKGNFAGDAADDLLLIEGGSAIQTLINVPGAPFSGPVTTTITDSVQSAAAGHFDADGFLDLAVAVPWDHVALYHGNGDGTFRLGGSFLTTSNSTGVAVGDFNGDGLADVVLSPYYSSDGVAVHFGDGNGNLGVAVRNPYIGSGSSVTTTDVNGDGKLDLLTGDDHQVTLLLGHGDGHFHLVWSHWSSNSGGAVTAGDFNEDGKIDLFVVAERDGPFKLHLGVGDGTFSAPTSHRLIGGTSFKRIKALDMDGDGHLDVVAGSITGPISVLRGKGNGTFYQPEHWFTESILSLYTGDFDRDGTTDIVFRLAYQGGRLSFIRGTGGGGLDAYRTEQVTAANGSQRQAAATSTADMNGDGKPDLVVVTSDSNSVAREMVVFLNTGGGNWAPPIITELLQVEYPRKPAIGDVNGDGKQDVVVANGVYLGHGDGTFAAPLSLQLTGSGATFLADLNGDSKLDLVVPNDASSSTYLGSGTGSFSAATPVDLLVGAISDLNGDGRPDLAGRSSSYSGNTRVALNDGSGGFTVTEVDVMPHRDFGTAGDFNNDGRADIMVGTYGGTRVIFGRGDGTFGNPVDFKMNSWFDFGATAGDLNGDGNLDVVTGSHIHLGDGSGRFPSYAHVLGGWATQNAIADFDGDGDRDLVITSSVNAMVALVQPNIGPDPPVSPTMTLVAQPASPRYAQAVQYTATLSAPTVQRNGGAIVLYQDGVPVELQILLDTQAGVFSTAWTTGAHSVTAKYTGDSHHAGVEKTLQHDVPRGATYIFFSFGSPPRACAVEIFVSVYLNSDRGDGLPGPTGDFVFREGATVITSRRGSSGYYLSGLGVGTHTISVDYPGDDNYEPSSATFQQVITPSVFAAISASSGVYANEGGNIASVVGYGPTGSTVTWSITNGTIDSGGGTIPVSYTAGPSGEVTLTAVHAIPGSLCEATATAVIPILGRPPGASLFYTVKPCRLLDTRGSTPLTDGTRDITVGGGCAVPVDAKSVVANVTVIAPASNGWMSLYPTGAPWPGTSTINYRLGKSRANNAVIRLSGAGQLTVKNSGPPVHFIIDVFGYVK